jgi:hypothetical protein
MLCVSLRMLSYVGMKVYHFFLDWNLNNVFSFSGKRPMRTLSSSLEVPLQPVSWTCVLSCMQIWWHHKTGRELYKYWILSGPISDSARHSHRSRCRFAFGWVWRNAGHSAVHLAGCFSIDIGSCISQTELCGRLLRVPVSYWGGGVLAQFSVLWPAVLTENFSDACGVTRVPDA